MWVSSSCPPSPRRWYSSAAQKVGSLAAASSLCKEPLRLQQCSWVQWGNNGVIQLGTSMVYARHSPPVLMQLCNVGVTRGSTSSGHSSTDRPCYASKRYAHKGISPACLQASVRRIH